MPGRKYTVEFWFWPGIEQDGELLAVSGRSAMTARNSTSKAWHHAMFVSNGKNAQAFIDGNPLPAGDARMLESLRIGAGFEGKIDEIAVYPRALSAKTLYRPKRFSK